jgi:hypothetical protein
MNEVTSVEERTSVVAVTPKTSDISANAPLLTPEFVQSLRSRWDRIQAGFVDEPRTAVQQADELVAAAIKGLEESFADARNNLEQQWSRGDQVNTEDLRVALTKYRSFFQKLLSV